MSREKLYEWAMDDVKMTSVNISKCSTVMLVSMNKDTVKLMAIETGEVIRNMTGHKQQEFMIRSTFGGANENFIVSGSEG